MGARQQKHKVDDDCITNIKPYSNQNNFIPDLQRILTHWPVRICEMCAFLVFEPGVHLAVGEEVLVQFAQYPQELALQNEAQGMEATTDNESSYTTIPLERGTCNVEL